MAKLNPTLVMEMRSKYAAGGVTIEQLAREYHVSWNAARNAIKATSYQNVEGGGEPAAGAAERNEALFATLLSENQIDVVVEEDPIEAILRRRGAQSSEEAARARAEHNQEKEEDEHEHNG